MEQEKRLKRGRGMKSFIYILIGLCVLSGCSSIEVRAPVTHHTKDLVIIDQPDINIPTIPNSPESIKMNIDGKKVATFSKDGINSLIFMREQSIKNIKLLKEVVGANKDLISAHNSLVNMTKDQERRTNNLAVEYARTEEKLRREERARTLEKFGYQLLIILGIAAGI